MDNDTIRKLILEDVNEFAARHATDRSKIKALVKDEIEKVHALEREGVVPSAYRRSDGEGVGG
jgi:hypothetical protein